MTPSALLAPEVDATPEKELPETHASTPTDEPLEARLLQRPLTWAVLGLVLLTWNGVLASMGGPTTFIQGYDGVQYQLLARNRLAGHYEMGDQAHTVRLEGSHPMWRPALVWIIEGLARITGSVQVAGCLASALAVTFLELTFLAMGNWLFGRAAFLLLAAFVFCPTALSVWMMRLAMGQGPEPWAALMVLVGIGLLIASWNRNSWKLAITAGLLAGFAEWFRTGNLVIFAVPCLFYSMVGIGRRVDRSIGQPLAALAAFMLIAFVGGKLCPSPVDKTTVNLWGNLLETNGPQIYTWGDTGKPDRLYLGGLQIVDGTHEVGYDYAVRQSSLGHGPRLRDEVGRFVRLYLDRLREAVTGGFTGLRVFIGGFLLVCVGFTVLVLPLRRDDTDKDLHTLALAIAALAFYLGPIVLLRGDDPTHYTLVVLPLFALVAVRGILIAVALLKERLPDLTPYYPALRRAVCLFVIPPLVCLTLVHYSGAFSVIRTKHQKDEAQQASLDALHLDGKRVASRDMRWFVDRNVETILLPYATAEQLDAYALAHDIDGILLWKKDDSIFFSVTPYGYFPARLTKALGASKVFAPPREQGDWVWYPRLSRVGVRE